jgi:serpin B
MKQFLKLITMFFLIIGIFALVGCSNETKPINFQQTENFKTLNEVTYPSSSIKADDISLETVSALKAFTMKTMPELFLEEKNYVYSPLSLYMALSMLLEGVSNEEAKVEIEDLLGLDRPANRIAMKTVYTNNFYKNKNGMLRLANSIWFRNNYPVEDDYLKVLAEDYYAESYQTNFDSVGHQNIIDWINYYTEDFLELTKAKFNVPSDTIILLLNTIYFDNKWKVSFEKKDTGMRDFFTTDGKVQVEFMKHSVNSQYKETSNYQVAEDYFENNASITYILPKVGVNVFSLLDPEVLSEAMNISNSHTKVAFFVPKFKYFSEFQLNDPLMKLGVNEVFDSNSNSLDLMSKGRGLFVSEVKQNAGIEFSEAGVKAAAVTGIVVKESAAEEIYFELNRPFIYIIKDGSGIPLFVGLIQNPAAKEAV